jgi:hypothetical protein
MVAFAKKKPLSTRDRSGYFCLPQKPKLKEDGKYSSSAQHKIGVREAVGRHLGQPAKNTFRHYRNDPKHKFYVARHHFHPEVLALSPTLATLPKSVPIKLGKSLNGMSFSFTDFDKTADKKAFYPVPNVGLSRVKDAYRRMCNEPMNTPTQVARQSVRVDALDQ